MALTGLDIFKLLPKTNCKKCGKPTCLAFAMQLAAKKADICDCPDVSDEAKAALAGAAAPPIRLVSIGTNGCKLDIGQETVLFRHDEKFFNPAGVAVKIASNLDSAALEQKIEKVNKLKFVRVGQEIQIDLVAVEDTGGDAQAFAATAKAVAEKTDFGIILATSSAEAMKAGIAAVGDKKPLICSATKDNHEDMAKLAKEAGCAIVVSAPTLEELADISEKVQAAGLKDIILDPSSRELHDALDSQTMIRRAALNKNFRPLGYPTIAFVQNGDPYKQIAEATTLMCKYAGIVVVDADEPWEILPLLTVRMNLYTDPQKPVQVEAGLYEVGEPNENSPLLFTTNFSLTYYTVEGDVEASRVPAYILAVDTEGTSVLTAYSGDKLNEKIVKEHLDKFKAAEKIKHKKIIIPGYVAVMSGKLEEETGMEILVGPKESAMLPTYLKSTWK